MCYYVCDFIPCGIAFCCYLFLCPALLYHTCCLRYLRTINMDNSYGEETKIQQSQGLDRSSTSPRSLSPFHETRTLTWIAIAIFLQVVLLGLYGLFVGPYMLRHSKHTSASFTVEFTGEELITTHYSFQNAETSNWAGKPDPLIDMAWDELLSNSNIRVNQEELKNQHQDSIQLPDGGGYFAWTEFSHQLHCVVG